MENDLFQGPQAPMETFQIHLFHIWGFLSPYGRQC